MRNSAFILAALAALLLGARAYSAEPTHAILDKDGNVEQVIVWDGVTPWPAPKDAKTMSDAGKTTAAVPANAPVGKGWVYDPQAKAFDKSAAMKAQDAQAATDTAARAKACGVDSKASPDCAIILSAPTVAP